MKKNLFQAYAIIICIVAIIAFLIGISSLVFSCNDYLNPLYAGRTNISLSSFEYFKVDLLKTTTKEQFYIPNDAEIMNMYETAKNQQLLSVNHRIFRSLIVNSIVIILSIVLFFSHWRLMKKHEILSEG